MGGFGSGHGSGGTRPGAGRPKGKTKAVYMSIRCTPEEREALKKRAHTAGLSVSEYVLIMGISGQEKK